MRKSIYELTVIFTPVLKEKGLSGAIASIEALVKKHKGKVLEFEDQGKQKFAYSIQKYKEGIYVFWKLQLNKPVVNTFEAELKLQKGNLRHLLVLSPELVK